MARISGALVPMVFGSAQNYPIQKSLRFNSADASYLSRTPGVAGNQQKWTWSAWVKRCQFGVYHNLLMARNGGGADWSLLNFLNTDNLAFQDSTAGNLTTTAAYRDPSAWYHVVFAMDTTQATAANRLLLYVNGVQVTSFSTATYPSQNQLCQIDSTLTHQLGVTSTGLYYLNGYMADYYLIDGQQLAPTSFGQINSTTGQWVPKAYSGSYGTTGCKLTFADNSSTTALGYDTSGVGNNWSTSGFSVTAGVDNDSMQDTPTNNYCTLNPIGTNYTESVGAYLSNGSLRESGTGSAHKIAFGTIALTENTYWEATLTTASSSVDAVGFVPVGQLIVRTDAFLSYDGLTTSYGYFGTGTIRNGPSSTTIASVATYTTGDVIGVSYNTSTREAKWYKNNTLIYTLTLNDYIYLPAINTYSGGVWNVNFGQRAFAYTPPTGFKSLCTANLPTPSIVKSATQFNVNTYTGTGASQSIVNAGSMQPDLVWVKSRSAATNHRLVDSVRGNYYSVSNNDSAEVASSALTMQSDGFAVGVDSDINNNGATYVGWQWKKGPTPGFDVVLYTGDGNNRTIAHGLGVPPEFIITRSRNTSLNHWQCYHAGIPSAALRAIQLNISSGYSATDSVYWNSTAPTSSVFSLGTYNEVNGAGKTYFAYLFASVPGFSKIGAYTGNGSSDGPFVWCGFRPKWVVVKRGDSGSTHWKIHYPEPPYAYTSELYVNLANTGYTASTFIDFLSNGFKIRTSSGDYNGTSMIYMAFAEAPFKYSTAR